MIMIIYYIILIITVAIGSRCLKSLCVCDEQTFWNPTIAMSLLQKSHTFVGSFARYTYDYDHTLYHIDNNGGYKD